MSVCFALNVALRVKYDEVTEDENEDGSIFVFGALDKLTTWGCKLVDVIVDEDLVILEELLGSIEKEEDVNLVSLFGWYNCGVKTLLEEKFIVRQLLEIKVGVKKFSFGNLSSFTEFRLLFGTDSCWTVLEFAIDESCNGSVPLCTLKPSSILYAPSARSGFCIGDNLSTKEEFSGDDRTEFSHLVVSFVNSQISLLMKLAVELDELEEEAGAWILSVPGK